jgi:hypothetical protein
MFSRFKYNLPLLNVIVAALDMIIGKFGQKSEVLAPTICLKPWDHHHWNVDGQVVQHLCPILNF